MIIDAVYKRRFLLFSHGIYIVCFYSHELEVGGCLMVIRFTHTHRHASRKKLLLNNDIIHRSLGSKKLVSY